MKVNFKYIKKLCVINKFFKFLKIIIYIMGFIIKWVKYEKFIKIIDRRGVIKILIVKYYIVYLIIIILIL